VNTNLLTNAARSANILKAFQPYLQKAGEGSKGGKVIGHTKSGKPIYDSSHSVDHAGNMISNDPNQRAETEQFRHHRLLSAYHAGTAMEMVHKEKADPKSKEVKHHLAESQKHVQEAKKLHNKKEHGGWMDTIPEHSEAKKYATEHYKNK
jgi:hypothetical protein